MKYSDDCKVYRIRYYNVWFYLFAKTEMDEYKINILGERIGRFDDDEGYSLLVHQTKYKV
jgi:hypothetical protein